MSLSVQSKRTLFHSRLASEEFRVWERGARVINDSGVDISVRGGWLRAGWLCAKLAVCGLAVCGCLSPCDRGPADSRWEPSAYHRGPTLHRGFRCVERLDSMCVHLGRRSEFRSVARCAMRRARRFQMLFWWSLRSGMGRSGMGASRLDGKRSVRVRQTTG